MSLQKAYSGTQRYTLCVSQLRGIDLQTNPTAMAPERSPNCGNMLRDTPGCLQKRPGFRQVAAYDGAVHGCWELDGTEILHAGTKLYAAGSCIAQTMADARSCGAVVGGRLYLLDGSEYRYVEKNGTGYTVQPVSAIAYCPRIAAGKDPDGSGGTELEEVNLLSDGWRESFYADGSATVYQLEFGGLSAQTVQVSLKSGSTTQSLTEGTHFSVNRTTGTLTFASAPAASAVEGEDNLFVTAYRDRSSQRSRITQSDVCFVWGESTAGVRLFVTGAPDWKNRDFWSAVADPTYFGDLSYSVLGGEDSRIIGYSLLGEKLAAHKNGENGEVWVRTADLQTGTDAAGNTRQKLGFLTARVITGPGAVACGSFAVLGKEPLFLTAQGVFALTPADLTGEQYQQRRSYYIDPALCAETNLAAASAVVWKDFYLVAVGGKIYCLDGLQTSTPEGFSTTGYQYECYLMTDVPARLLWVRSGVLYFGTQDGRVCRFVQDGTAAQYQDTLTGQQPTPVCAFWETPDLVGNPDYRDKNYRWLSVNMRQAPASSVQLSVRREGSWLRLQPYREQARYFSFSWLCFSRFTFCGTMADRTVAQPLHERRATGLRFRFENNTVGEALGLLGWSLEFTQGRYSRR